MAIAVDSCCLSRLGRPSVQQDTYLLCHEQLGYIVKKRKSAAS